MVIQNPLIHPNLHIWYIIYLKTSAKLIFELAHLKCSKPGNRDSNDKIKFELLLECIEYTNILFSKNNAFHNCIILSPKVWISNRGDSPKNISLYGISD